MSKAVFISIVHEDKKDVIHTLENWKKQNFLPGITFIFEEDDVRHKGEAEVKNYLATLISRVHVMVFIIGQDTHNHDWIKWEYSYAQNKGIKLVFLRLNWTTGALPELFPRVIPEYFTLANFLRLV